MSLGLLLTLQLNTTDRALRLARTMNRALTGLAGIGGRIRALRHRSVNRVGAALMIRLWPELPGQRITLVSRFFNVTINFALNALVLWALIWLLVPGLLGSTSAGMQSLAQAIPATIVALFVFTLGALVGIAQLSINAYGQRAALMLVEDYAVAVSVIRPLILAVTALLLAGQIPDSGTPATWTTAALATLALLTVAVIVTSVGLLGGTLLRYTAPLSFSDLVVDDVELHLSLGAVRLVRWKVPMFEEMIKLAIRRGDSAAVSAALQGLGGIVRAYAVASHSRRDARGLGFEDDDPPVTMYGWLGEDLRESLTRIGEDALRQSAPSEDSDHTVERMEDAATIFLRNGLNPEAKRIVRGLIALGCSTHQVGQGYTNTIVRPASALVRLIRVAEASGDSHLAAYCLAGWLLLISYADEHFGAPDQPLGRHPNWEPGLRDLGNNPPWEGAADVLQSDEWQRQWANQMNFGVQFVVVFLGLAIDIHGMLQRGEPMPPMPTWDQLNADDEAIDTNP